MGWGARDGELMSTNEAESARRGWTAGHVYTTASICLALGLLLGYLFRDSQSYDPQPARNSAPSSAASASGLKARTASPQAMPTLQQLGKMADQQAAPLLKKLKRDPTNVQLLNKMGLLYRATHQFEQAAGYYRKALQVAPENVAIRTDLASCLYYQGDVDGALDQLQQSLRYDAKDANSLFNLGMIRWQAKKDTGGAVTAWEQLLKSNPQLAEARKNEVHKLIAQARRQGAN
jgi:cytochrome c-type biogenesis protein CcmH/NrfG